MAKLKTKTKINLIIDAIMFLQMMAIAGIGFMIKYVLVPGFKRNDIYGRDVDLTFWGLDRHEWGSIHLYISFTFLFLLILHIVLHWKMVVRIFKHMVSVRSVRIIITVTILVFSVLFFIGPLFVNPSVSDWQGHHQHHGHHHGTESGQRNKQTPAHRNIHGSKEQTETIEKQMPGKQETQEAHESCNEDGHHKENHENLQSIAVYGYMTINEVAEKYDMDPAEICRRANIPEEYANEKLGRLRKRYGFRLSDIKNIVKSSNK